MADQAVCLGIAGVGQVRQPEDIFGSLGDRVVVKECAVTGAHRSIWVDHEEWHVARVLMCTDAVGDRQIQALASAILPGHCVSATALVVGNEQEGISGLVAV